jgi:hypothetical protein
MIFSAMAIISGSGAVPLLAGHGFRFRFIRCFGGLGLTWPPSFVMFIIPVAGLL